MKFTCLQDNLVQALSKVYRAVPTKSELPILANVLISAENDRLKLSATNLSTTIVTFIGASIEKEGSITIPAKILKEYISNLNPGTLDMKLTDDVLHISSSGAKTKINGVTADDFPDLPEEKKDLEVIELDPKVFFKAVASVAFSASADDSRPIFTGIYLFIKDGMATLAASDGYRLSEVKFAVANKKTELALILPSKTLLDISKVFSDSGAPLQLLLDKNENLALFKQDDTLIATRLIEGDYPDYKKIIPEGSAISAELLSSELMEAVRLTDIFAKEADSALVMKIKPDGVIELTAIAQDAGEHKSTIKGDITCEEQVEIGFNSKFLLDFLNNLKEEKILLYTNGNSSPCLFKSLKGDDYLHIIMPMQINNS